MSWAQPSTCIDHDESGLMQSAACTALVVPSKGTMTAQTVIGVALLCMVSCDVAANNTATGGCIAGYL